VLLITHSVYNIYYRKPQYMVQLSNLSAILHSAEQYHFPRGLRLSPSVPHIQSETIAACRLLSHSTMLPSSSPSGQGTNIHTTNTSCNSEQENTASSYKTLHTLTRTCAHTCKHTHTHTPQ